MVELARREEVVDAFIAAFAPEQPFLWASIAAASVLGLVGIAGNLQGGRRTLGAVLSAAWLLLGPVVLRADLGRDRLVALALALP